MSGTERKLIRQINKQNLIHKKVIAKKLGISLAEYNSRMLRREKNLRELEENNNG